MSRVENTCRIGRRRLLAPLVSCALLGLGAISIQAWAEDGIVAVRENGRVIFVNNEAPAPSKVADTTSAAPSTRRLVYWSNTEHRWKRVPPPTRTAMRNARSAAKEVAELVAITPKTSDSGFSVSPIPIEPTAPDTRNLISGHKITQPEVDAAIEAAAARHNVDVNLVRSIIKVESNFNPHAVSRKGAIGLMQLMPATARELKVHNPFDINQNIDGGVRHFKGLLQDFGGDLRKSLAAYNAGAGAVSRNGGVPPYAETQNYVRRITQLYGQDNPFGQVKNTSIRISRDSNGHRVFTND